MCAVSLEGRKVCFAVGAVNVIVMRNVSSLCERTMATSGSCGDRSCCAQARDVVLSSMLLTGPSALIRALFRRSEGPVKNTGIFPGVTFLLHGAQPLLSN